MTPTAASVLDRLGISSSNSGACHTRWLDTSGAEELISYNPSDGVPMACVRTADARAYDEVIANAQQVFERWRMHPAPKRGEIVREIGDELRKFKNELGTLVSMEMGKILNEGVGEV